MDLVGGRGMKYEIKVWKAADGEWEVSVVANAPDGWSRATHGVRAYKTEVEAFEVAMSWCNMLREEAVLEGRIK